jgi:hypothetical protein
MSDDLQARAASAVAHALRAQCAEMGGYLHEYEPCDDDGNPCGKTLLRVDAVIDHRLIAAAIIDEMSTWATLMDLLDLHYPADIFPTMPDTPNRDPGPRIISLIRTVDQLRWINCGLRTNSKEGNP